MAGGLWGGAFLPHTPCAVYHEQARTGGLTTSIGETGPRYAGHSPRPGPSREATVDPALKPWIDLWDFLDGNFWAVWEWAAADLSPDEVGWQPAPRVASVGWNLQHLAEMLDHYLAHVFDRGPPVWPGPLVTMRRASQDDGRFRDLEAVAAYHRQVRPAYR